MNPTPKIPVRSWVREARRNAGLTQQQLAEKAGISRRAVQFIEYGSYVPAVGVALRLAQALGTEVGTLFTLTEPSHSATSPTP